jgi:hypothetical protein
MKKILLTAMALTVSLLSLAEQPASKTAVQGETALLSLTLIEDKNRGIMSSYKDYSQRYQQNRLVKQNLIQQQYHQFMEEKRISGSTASL